MTTLEGDVFKGGEKSPSQHISEVLGGILQDAISELKDELRESTKAHRESTKMVAKLEASMHHPPCPEMCTMKAEIEVRNKYNDDKFKVLHNRVDDVVKSIEEHQEEHEQERRDKMQFYRNVGAVVLAAVCLFILGAALIGMDHGARPSGVVSNGN